MKCPFCGQEHPDNSKFCPETGNKIEKSSLSCPSCGRSGIPLGSNFCPDCRFRFNENYACQEVNNELIKQTSPDNSQMIDINKLNIKECERFLKIHPNHPQTEAIRKRKGELEMKKSETHARELQPNTKWMDINELLEKKKYRDIRPLRNVFLVLFFILAIVPSSIVLYYITIKHEMKSKHDYEQADKVFGLERIALYLDLISVPYPDVEKMNLPHSDDPYTDYYQEYYKKNNSFYKNAYRATDGLSYFLGWAFICLLLYFLLKVFHSPIIRKIYNIEMKDFSEKVRAIQDENGKLGLCKIGKFRIKQLLPFEYTLMNQTHGDCYICRKDNKIGLYNSLLKKMVLPLEYDSVDLQTEKYIQLTKENKTHRFSYTGFRILE